MERAIKSLCQLPDTNLFDEIATGVDLIIESVRELYSASHGLRETDSHRAARVLRNLAEEEALKVLILVDAVRCPLDRQEEKSRALGYFYDHLAKGIYAEAPSGSLPILQKFLTEFNRYASSTIWMALLE